MNEYEPTQHSDRKSPAIKNLLSNKKNVIQINRTPNRLRINLDFQIGSEFNKSFLFKSQNKIREGNDSPIPTSIITAIIGNDSGKSLRLPEFTIPSVKNKMNGETRMVKSQTLIEYFRLKCFLITCCDQMYLNV